MTLFTLTRAGKEHGSVRHMERYPGSLDTCEEAVSVVSFSDGKLRQLSQRRRLCDIKQNVGEGGGLR